MRRPDVFVLPATLEMMLMWRRMFRDARSELSRRRRLARRAGPVGPTGPELLDRRVLPSVAATFTAAQGMLTVTGDAHPW
jgi:hypothetical protein